MADKIKELLAVLDMPEDEHRQAVLDILDEKTMEWFWDGDKSLADLAFRLNDGKISGKKPIEWIIEALVKEEEKR